MANYFTAAVKRCDPKLIYRARELKAEGFSLAEMIVILKKEGYRSATGRRFTKQSMTWLANKARTAEEGYDRRQLNDPWMHQAPALVDPDECPEPKKPRGRPEWRHPPALLARARELRQSGLTYRKVAAALNEEGFISARGRAISFKNVFFICNPKPPAKPPESFDLLDDDTYGEFAAD